MAEKVFADRRTCWSIDWCSAIWIRLTLYLMMLGASGSPCSSTLDLTQRLLMPVMLYRNSANRHAQLSF